MPTWESLGSRPPALGDSLQGEYHFLAPNKRLLKVRKQTGGGYQMGKGQKGKQRCAGCCDLKEG